MGAIRWLDRLGSQRIKRLGREFLWVGLGQAIAALGAVAGVRILTGVLTAEAYGQVALSMTIVTLWNQTVLSPLSNAAMRFFAPAHEARALRDYFTVLERLSLQVTGIILLLASVLCAGLILVGESHWIKLMIAAVAVALLGGYNSMLDSVQSAARQRSVVALHQGLISWTRFLLAAGLVVWLGGGSTTAVMGYGLAMVPILLSQVFFLRRRILPLLASDNTPGVGGNDWRGAMLAYAWPFGVFGIFTWMQTASDRWSLQTFATTPDVGLYAVLYQLGYYPIIMACLFSTQLLSPLLFARAGDASDSSRVEQAVALNWRFTAGMLGFAVLTTLLALALHRPVFRLLVAPAYRSVSWLLPGMVLAGGLFATGQLASLALMSTNNVVALIPLKIGTAIAGVLLSLVGAARWGITGVVLASIAFSLLYCVWTCLLVHRYYAWRRVSLHSDMPR